MRLMMLILALPLAATVGKAETTNGILVFQSDFGSGSGAVAAMHGIAATVDPELRLEDLTHEIPPFDIWQGAYWLNATAPYWPAGTVFVSFVAGGGGGAAKPVVLKTASSHFFVTPDNGTLTLVAEALGIEAVRAIDQAANRPPGEQVAAIRDVYAFTGARLAAGAIPFDKVGPVLPPEVATIEYQPAEIVDNRLKGSLAAIEAPFGNVWTNIGKAVVEQFGMVENDRLAVIIKEGERVAYEGVLAFQSTIDDAPEGEPRLYLNGQGDLALAVGWGSFAEAHGLSAGPAWSIEVRRP